MACRTSDNQVVLESTKASRGRQFELTGPGPTSKEDWADTPLRWDSRIKQTMLTQQRLLKKRQQQRKVTLGKQGIVKKGKKTLLFLGEEFV